MTRIIERIIIAALGAAVIILLLQYCSEKKGRAQDNKNFEKDRTAFTERYSKAGERIAYQETIITEQGTALAKSIEEVEGLKQIVSQAKVKTETNIVEVLVPYSVPPVIIKDTSGNKFLKLPIPLALDTSKWYNLHGMLTEKGFRIDSMKIKNDFKLTYGYKKKKSIKDLFKPDVLTLSVQDNNPYSRTTAMQNITIKEKDKRFSISLQCGYGITTKGLGGYAGIGVNYTLIQL